VWGADPETLIASAFASRPDVGGQLKAATSSKETGQFSSAATSVSGIVLGTPIFEADAQKPNRMLWCCCHSAIGRLWMSGLPRA